MEKLPVAFAGNFFHIQEGFPWLLLILAKMACASSRNIFHIFRSVSVGVFVNTGSRDERPDENGITHFIEHLLFKGTKTRSAKDIAREFDRIGGDLNAYTSKEYTCYYAKVLDHHAPLAVDVLADMFFQFSDGPSRNR